MLELTEDQLALMDSIDKEIYRNKLIQHAMLAHTIEENIQIGNRYTHPFQVLDTDYDTYLLTYSCREELRVPHHESNMDDFITDNESYRKLIEEYDHSPEMLAKRIIEIYWMDPRFQVLKEKL